MENDSGDESHGHDSNDEEEAIPKIITDDFFSELCSKTTSVKLFTYLLFI